jgi:DNA-binding transcriptional regulator/RsmH inhibitor MraZ
MNKREKLRRLKQMDERTEQMNGLLRSDLRELELDAADEIAISTAIYALTDKLRRATLEAREKIVRERP